MNVDRIEKITYLVLGTLCLATIPFDIVLHREVLVIVAVFMLGLFMMNLGFKKSQ